MILVDTSILIGYFKGLSGLPYDKLDEIIDNQIPFGINNHIYQEVLQGAKTEKEFNQLKEYLDVLPFYDLHNGRKSYENAALMYVKCRKLGVTVRSTVDLIIAQTAIEHNLYLLHNDNDYTNIAKVIKELKLYK
ncbi:MAG: PIN domain nuclease [Candidatus Symbiothrix sp.]|jgi:predicted nucleic acid-binding protein|nr:PIN domain nuclease [Candidatus Symbiothrix sp.]